MAIGKPMKTEHNGAKNGGGYWGTRREAKAGAKKLRRRESKRVICADILSLQGPGVGSEWSSPGRANGE